MRLWLCAVALGTLLWAALVCLVAGPRLVGAAPVYQPIDRLAGGTLHTCTSNNTPENCGAAVDVNDATSDRETAGAQLYVLYDMGASYNIASFRVVAKNGVGSTCDGNSQIWHLVGGATAGGVVSISSNYSYDTSDTGACVWTVNITPANYRYIGWFSDGSGCSGCGFFVFTISAYESSGTATPTPSVTHTATGTPTVTPTVTHTPTGTTTPIVVAGQCGYGELPPCHVYWQTPGPVYWETPGPVVVSGTVEVFVNNWPTPIPTATPFGGTLQETAIAVATGAPAPDPGAWGGPNIAAYPVSTPRILHNHFVRTWRHLGPCVDLGLFFDTSVCFNYHEIEALRIGHYYLVAWPFMVLFVVMIIRWLIQR